MVLFKITISNLKLILVLLLLFFKKAISKSIILIIYKFNIFIMKKEGSTI